MAKLWNYIVIMSTMILVMEFVGIQTGLSIILADFGVTINSNNSKLVTADLATSSIYNDIFGSAGVLVLFVIGGTLIIGFFAKTYDTSLIVAPLIVTVGTLYISTFWGVLLYVQGIGQSWLIALFSVIFIPLGIGFIWSCVDYFKGEV